MSRCLKFLLDPLNLERRASGLHYGGAFLCVGGGDRLLPDVPGGRVSEEALVFAGELRAAFVAHASCRGLDAEGLDEHKALGLVKAQAGREGLDKVFIEAIRDIKPGEELTYNYGITLAERHTPRLKKIWECRCGSRKCTGTMLQPKR